MLEMLVYLAFKQLITRPLFSAICFSYEADNEHSCNLQ